MNNELLDKFISKIRPSDHLPNCSLVLYSIDNNKCTCGDDERRKKDYQKALSDYKKIVENLNE